jgi:Fe2+ or Zn2+ uptake regulation protein
MDKIKYEALVLNFLAVRKDKKYTVMNLAKEMKDAGIKISYPTVLKWCDLLTAKGLIKSEVYNSVKIVWFG